MDPILPYSNLHIGTLQAGLKALLTEEELDQLGYLYSAVAGRDGGVSPSILSDKVTLAALYKVLTLERLSSKEYRRSILLAMPSTEISELSTVAGQGPMKGVEGAVDTLLSQPWQDTPLWRRFLEFLRLPSSLLPTPGQRELDQFDCTPFDPPLRSLFDYQVDVYQRSLECVKVPNGRLLLQMPTGSGKTRTAMEVIATFMRERITNQVPVRVVWVSHVGELCEQSLVSFEQVWKHTGNTPVRVLRLWGDHPVPTELPPNSFAVVGFQKFLRLLRRGEGTFPVDLVTVDEAHVALAPRYNSVLSLFQGGGTRYLGLTATPGRTQQESVATRSLAKQFGNNLIGLDFGETQVITALQRKGVLSVLDRQELRTSLPVDLTQEEWDTVAKNGDYPPAILRRIAQDRSRNLAILNKLREIATLGLQTIVFASSVGQSRILAAMMVALGYPACHLDADTPREIRRVFIDRFKAGETKFLMNFGILSTGFDAPLVGCVVIARPTTSIVLYSQMVGRGLRGPSVGGTPTCVLVDVVDNFENMPGDITNVYDYFSGYWGDQS